MTAPKPLKQSRFWQWVFMILALWNLVLIWFVDDNRDDARYHVILLFAYVFASWFETIRQTLERIEYNQKQTQITVSVEKSRG